MAKSVIAEYKEKTEAELIETTRILMMMSRELEAYYGEYNQCDD